jgi:hypothetical protein
MGMLRIKNTFVSELQPAVSDGLWLKVIGGKVALYLIEAGTPKPLQLVDDNNTAASQDDIIAETTKKVKTDLVGNSTDAKTADTINGAKTYAKDQANSLLGTAEDTATEMTLYGLKAYIDSKVPGQ